ncbi:MAG: protease pro-enzyme activation domain-containing protein [Ktedonobacteraceae bacterium]
MSSKFSFGGNGRKPKSIFPFIVVPLLSLALIAGLLSVYLLNNANAASADQSVPFAGTIPAAVAHSQLTGPADPNQTLSLTIGLNLRNASVLKNYVNDISNRKSVNFHRYLTSAQFQAAFSPGVAAHNALLSYLKSNGFTITHTYTHRMLIAFTGTVAQAEQVFHVTINNYTAPSGRTFYSNANNPLVPSSLFSTIQSISGLNNYAHWSHGPQAPRKLASNSNANPNSVSCLTGGSNYYTPAQIQTAYNLNGLYAKGFHGEGQRVALFELDTFVPGDLTAYQSCYDKGSPTHIQTVVIPGHQPPTDGGVVEVELDAELVLSTAPKLGALVIYESSNNTSGYNDEWARIIQDAPPVVSDSWGACESDFGSTEVNLENNFFTAAAAQGQNIFVASGDSGSSGCYFDGYSNTQNNLEPGDPSAQPYITSVGGTSLNWNGSSASETVWNDAPQNGWSGGASTGGLSLTFPMPLWQSQFNVPGVQNQYSNGKREAPDVSLNADPNVGYLVFCTSTAAGCVNGQWWVYGGTSAAAPMWAAMMALTNQESIKAGGFNLGFVNPLLYQLASSPTSYANDFHDVTTSGNNDYNNLHGGLYPVTTGYDMATGLGSFNAANLAADLVNLALSASGKRAAPAASTWYFAEGYIGNNFEELFTIQNPDPVNTSNFSITYVFPSGPSIVKTHSIAASSRTTISVNTDLGVTIVGPSKSVSAIVQVTSGPNIVVERPMYFKYVNGGITIQSGTDVLGATKFSKSFYFAEGDTRQTTTQHYWTYVIMMNPSQTTTAHATVTYYTGACGGTGPACLTQTFTIAPLQRAAAAPFVVNLHQQVAISVIADQSIVAERPMYVQDNIATAGGSLSGAVSQVGATTPGNDWLFAEGYTGVNFQQYFVLANFGATQATATIKMEYNGGGTKTVSATVKPFSQTYVNVNQINAGVSNSAAAEITSDQPIVADRLMYFHQGASKIAGISDVVGEAGPAAHSVYAFAEGYTTGNFLEVLTVLNPTAQTETIALTFFTPGTVFQQQAVVKPFSRVTFSVNNILNPVAPGSNSVTIQALPTTGSPSPVIVVERPMYFTMTLPGVSGIQHGGNDIIGFTG